MFEQVMQLLSMKTVLTERNKPYRNYKLHYACDMWWTQSPFELSKFTNITHWFIPCHLVFDYPIWLAGDMRSLAWYFPYSYSVITYLFGLRQVCHGKHRVSIRIDFLDNDLYYKWKQDNLRIVYDQKKTFTGLCCYPLPEPSKPASM